jgi:hypothetical protein
VNLTDGNGKMDKNCIMYFSPNIIRVIKSWRMECKGHIARMEKIYPKNLMEGDYLGNVGVYRRTILKWILKK